MKQCVINYTCNDGVARRMDNMLRLGEALSGSLVGERSLIADFRWPRDQTLMSTLLDFGEVSRVC